MRCRNQRVEVSQAAELRIDIGVVGNVVAEVDHWRREDGRQPKCVDPKLDQMGQALHDPAQVADPISIAVLKRTRIDLINDARLPPARAVHVSVQSLA